MSGPQFTKGPWSIDGQAPPQGHPALVIAVQDFVIAEVFADCDTEEPEAQANAHLISAAPCMAAFVKKHADAGDQEAISLWGRINGRA